MSWGVSIYLAIGLLWVAVRRGARHARGMPEDSLEQMVLQLVAWLPWIAIQTAIALGENVFGKKKKED